MGSPGIATTLGVQIRARRNALGWSQAQLAEAVDVTPNYLGNLERGEALPTVQTLVDLAEALQATPGELLGGGPERDEWIDRLVATAVTVPQERRGMLLELVEVVAGHRRGAQKSGTRARRGRSKRS